MVVLSVEIHYGFNMIKGLIYAFFKIDGWI